MKKIAIASVLLLLTACASTPKTGSSQVSGKASDTPVKTSPAPITSSTPDMNTDIESQRLAAEKLAAEKLATEIQSLQRQSVYFDFDKFAVKPEYVEVIQKQAAFIKAHKNDSVTIEGNTDERGSDEYNLALGDRRANTVKKNLELLGVHAIQINAVSLGEEKPRLACHEEKCWQENRRDDFVHKLN